MKWKSFTIWQEMRGIVDTLNDHEYNHDDVEDRHDLYTELQFDIEGQFLNMVYQALGFMSIKLSKSQRAQLENFNIIFLNDLEIYISDHSIEFDERREREIFEKCQKEGMVYITKYKLIIISDLNANHLAEAVGQHIFSIFNPKPNELDPSENLLYNSLCYAIGLHTAKIFNPRRGFHDIG